MGRVLQFVFLAVLALFSLTGTALAQSRNALVIGNSAYESAPRLKTPATDAAIVAETLRAAGYDVTELRDVRQANIGQVMRDFLDKVAAGGPDGAAFFYFSGYGAQAEGENYLVPVDAVISNDGEVAREAFHLDDLLDELKDIPLAARIVVLDASRDHKFGSTGPRPVVKGLAMGDTIPGMLLAFAAAPGALAIDGDGDYSLYTGALVTMLRQPGLDMEQIFKATRVQVNQTTGGAQTPWMVSALDLDVRLFAAADAAPAPQTAPGGVPLPPKEERVVSKDMLRTLTPDDAYKVVVEEDTLEAYQWFVELYPNYQFAAQIWEIIETRREAVLWRRTLAQNTTRAYWNYLKRYPDGAHAGEAQERLDALSAPRTPPVTYVPAPEPLPPDYYDEAVGLVEIVPEGFEAPPSVFDVLGPLFLPRPPRIGFDRDRRRDWRPPEIPRVRGTPVGAFGPRIDRDRSRDRDRDRRKTGIVRGTPTPGTTRVTPGVRDNKKPGVNIPGGRRGTDRPVTGRPPVPGGGVVRPTTPGTPGGAAPGGTRRGGVALPPSGTPPTTRGPAATGRPPTPGATPGSGRPTTPGVAPGTDRPTTPGATPGGRPTTPGVAPGTGRPTTPGVAPGTGRPTTPGAVPGTGRPTTPGVAPGTGRPTTPGAVPGTSRPTTPGVTPPPTAPGVTRPGLPPVPGGTRPTTPAPTPPSAGQRPGLPPTPTPGITRPTTPSAPTPGITRPTPPTGRPTPPVSGPGVRPVTPPTTGPSVRPVTPPTVRPTAPPTVRPTAPPTVRPTAPPTTRPSAPPTVRPAPPATRPTPPRPTPPAVRPAPQRPAAPAVRPAPQRPAPVVRPAPQRPAPVVRPAPAARPAAPPPRQPVCTVVNGKRVCR